MDCAWTANIQFKDVLGGAPTIDGLDSWVAYSAGDIGIPLVLEENRCVRIQAFVDCPEDTDGNGAVNIIDLLEVLASWGPCPAKCAADTNCDGNVDIVDLLNVLAAWGPCGS